MKMIRFLMSILMLMTLAPQVYAESWTPGAGQQARVLPANRFPVLGNGSTTYGGRPPYLDTMPADIATSGYDLSAFSAPTDSAAYVTIAGGATEAKFRTICGAASHHIFDDPILYPNQPGKSHLHSFFGNTLANAYSNYRSLRTTGRSNCGGDIFNRTAYWIPSALVTVAGKRMIWRADQFVVYYKNALDRSNEFVDIPRDFAYISGPDPMTGYVDQNVAIVNKANADAEAAGSPMRYEIATAPNGRVNNGYLGVKCEYKIGDGSTQYSPTPGNDRQPYLLDANGNLTINCNPTGPNGETGHIVAEWNAPTCWDGKNGHGGPTARGHVAMAMNAHNIVTNEWRYEVCYDGWYKIPHLEMTAYFPIPPAGMNALKAMNPRWSSDDVPGYTYRAMESGHIDWFGAWDYGTNAAPGVMLRWMHGCTGTMGNQPAECNYSTIDSQLRLLSDSAIPFGYKDPPGSIRNGVIVDNNHDWVKKGFKGFLPIPKTSNTIHAH